MLIAATISHPARAPVGFRSGDGRASGGLTPRDAFL
jgi:hypothetical protein